jgi:ubiquinone/menaquinone biosynthesis C-methylase UbiE
MSNYIFDNSADQTIQRFSSLEELYDPRTIQRLQATGVGPGWQCWEVGAGGGSIASWLANCVGPSGTVLVTDIDRRFLEKNAGLDHANVEILHHDVGVDPMPSRTFDLIHARLVLVHVPTREQALERLVAALKPGGWLVIEDFDPSVVDPTDPIADETDAVLYRKMNGALYKLMVARSGGLAVGWGHSLFRRMQACGLAEVGMEGFMAVRKGGSPGARLIAANFEQIRTEAVAAGLVTDDDVARVLVLLADPAFAVQATTMFSGWGRKR